MDIDIESILPNRNFPDYTVFSINVNPLYFQFALPFLNQYIISKDPLYACQTHFEELVGYNSELQAEYVELYDSNNEFYLTNGRHDGQLYDIYILARGQQALMFFTRVAL